MTRVGLRRATLVVAAAGAAVLVFAAVAAGGGGNFKNGNFETGTFAPGWQHDCSSCDGDWFVSNKKVSPISGQSWYGPMEKEYEAVADENGADTNVLWQTFKVAKANSRLTFLIEWKNQAEVWCNPGDLAFTSDCGAPPYNQQIRVDIQPAGADPFDTASLMNLFQTTNSTPQSQGKTKITANLGGITGTVQLRVAAVSGQYRLLVGIDNVQVNNGG
jgi:hypothetical protein